MATVTFESFINKQKHIEIPAIQRDYVQGRGYTIEEQDKREAFVIKLINAIICDDTKPCHLEFIYGAENATSHSFIPLDGQQRLTTLFVLHWVVWHMSSDEAKKKHPLNEISGFRYETRLSSQSFCQKIITCGLLQVKDAKTLGQRLKQQPWFSEDWNYDPTIVAMISMIDFIEEKLQIYDKHQISCMLARLCSENNVITFDELNMTDYNLTDSLYIKMNARGKHLTPFENWKSDFIKFLENEFGNEQYEKADKSRKSLSYSYKDYFCYSIEHQWTDLFWTYLKEDYLNLDEKQQEEQYPSIDKMFMNLFDFLCMYHYYVQGNAKNDYNKASASSKRAIWQNKDFVDCLFGALDSLYRINHSIFFDELFYITNEELPLNNNTRKVRLFRTRQCNLFKLCVDNGASMELTDILLFYALLVYCEKNNVQNVNDALKSYIRNVRNYFESDIQNIRTRTTVQLNLRLSEFGKYDIGIKELMEKPDTSMSISDCIIDDCSLTHGNTQVFKKAIEEYGSEKVVEALKNFCNASQLERVRVLVACGFKGTYLSDCIGRNRYFFGNKDKWDVLFISDKDQLSKCFTNYTSKIKEGKDNSFIINEALIEHQQGFVYYILKYDHFINANDSQHHFAIKGDPNDVDWIALGSYSSNPGTAYHTDPFAFAVEKSLIDKYPDINLSLYKQYSGKCPISIVKDKIHWEPVFSVISRKNGWYIDRGFDLLTEDIISDFNIQVIPNQEENNNKILVPIDKNRDMVQLGIDIIERVHSFFRKMI
jgi:hypothetical protein